MSNDVFLMLVVFSPFAVFMIHWMWLKYTEHQIDKQHEERQDDE